MIDSTDLDKFIGMDHLSVIEAMQQMDQNAYGILMIVDSSKRLKGCLTDGDVRRYLLSGGKVGDNVMAAANRTPKYAESAAERARIYHKKNYIAIPVVDGQGKVVHIYLGEGEMEPPKVSLHIPVVINAGGKGTRLDPYTRVLPKPLIPVGDMPMIEHIMGRFMEYGCREFHLIVNYKKEILKGYFAGHTNQYQISWHEETQPLGTGGGLTLLKGQLDGTFFFTNCDNLLLSNYDSILRFHHEHKNMVTMVCAYKNMQIPYGVVEMGIDGAIEHLTEKPRLSFLTNTGIYVVEPEVIEDMEDNRPADFPDVVIRQKEKGRNVSVYPVSENGWLDMGQMPELESMQLRLKENGSF